MKSKQFLAVSIMMLSLQTVHAQGHIKHAFNVLTTQRQAPKQGSLMSLSLRSLHRITIC